MPSGSTSVVVICGGEAMSEGPWGLDDAIISSITATEAGNWAGRQDECVINMYCENLTRASW